MTGCFGSIAGFREGQLLAEGRRPLRPGSRIPVRGLLMKPLASDGMHLRRRRVELDALARHQAIALYADLQ